MRRLAAILVMLAAVVVLVLGTGAGNGGSYKIRAIFDNAFSAVPDLDVKIAGVKVGKVESLDVTKQQKAALVLRITDPALQDFRADASCIIRPQSLIGEKFVECTPTQPRGAGDPVPPPLAKIKHGDGKGQHLITLAHTSSPIDLDLLNNILRRPYAERLSIILGELGTAVAGRGQDLNEVIRRANPALQQTDRVLKILADQNRVLANLARDSDTVLAPLARDRAHVSGTIVQSQAVAQATAERGDDLERTFERLPPFLTELRPTMVRLGALSDQATPVLADLGAVAPSINSFIRQLGPFSRAALPALRTLGNATDVGTPALIHSLPTIKLLRTFASRARPVGANLAALTTSLQQTGGIERLLDYAFYQVTAINGFDAFGHYLRAALILTGCTDYATTPASGCSANFGGGSATSSSIRAALARYAAAARKVRAATAGPAQPPAAAKSKAAAPQHGIKLPEIVLPGRLGQPHAGGTAAPSAPGATTIRQPGVHTSSEPSTGMLNYLLGPDG